MPNEGATWSHADRGWLHNAGDVSLCITVFLLVDLQIHDIARSGVWDKHYDGRLIRLTELHAGYRLALGSHAGNLHSMQFG